MIILFDRFYKAHIIDAISSTKIHTRCGELLQRTFGINTLCLDLSIDKICKKCKLSNERYFGEKYDPINLRDNSLENFIEYYIRTHSAPQYKFSKCFARENAKLVNICRKLGRRKIGHIL
jgi:hypothetical protein